MRKWRVTFKEPYDNDLVYSIFEAKDFDDACRKAIVKAGEWGGDIVSLGQEDIQV